MFVTVHHSLTFDDKDIKFFLKEVHRTFRRLCLFLQILIRLRTEKPSSLLHKSVNDIEGVFSIGLGPNEKETCPLV